MGELYTVTIEREHNTSTFDAKGNVARTTTWIPETHRDLPYATARRYADMVPMGRAEVVRQSGGGDDSHYERNGSRPSASRSVYHEELKHELSEAAVKGDMAAAVTAELEAS